jgi:hypothetical protein
MNTQRKLKPKTVRKIIRGIAVKTKRLNRKEYTVRRQIQRLKEQVVSYQKRCPHKTTRRDDYGYYNFCKDCGAAVGRGGQIIPEDSIEYPE